MQRRTANTAERFARARPNIHRLPVIAGIRDARRINTPDRLLLHVKFIRLDPRRACIVLSHE